MMKRVFKISLPLFILFAVISSAKAQKEPVVSAELDTAVLMVGQQTEVELKVFANAGDTVLFPEIKGDTITSSVEVIEKSKTDTSYDKDNISTKLLLQKIRITSFDSGYHALPPFSFIVNGDTMESEPLLLHVQIPVADTSQAIKDIKGPVDIPFSLKEWLVHNWYWIAGILVLIILILIALKYYKKLIPEKKEVEIEKEPEIPAHVIARKRLEKLKEQKLWQNGKVKAFHVALSEITREYLRNRYSFNAPEQTTDEILSHLRFSTVNEEEKHLLLRVLKLSDLVKFAKEKPLPSENEAAMESALSFVEKTKIVVPEQSEGKEQKGGGS